MPAEPARAFRAWLRVLSGGVLSGWLALAGCSRSGPPDAGPAMGPAVVGTQLADAGVLPAQVRPDGGPAAPSTADAGGGAGAGAGSAAGAAPAPADAAAPAMDAGAPAMDAGPGASADAGGDAGAGAGDACERLDPAQPPQALMLSGNLGTHDPSIIAAGGRYYVFQTGPGIPTKSSSDLLSWSAGPAVFSSNPAWIAQQVPGASDLWAPDISFFGGQYHLYYAASTFGSNHSCIGHATRTSLSSGSWSDHGAVICSNASGQNDNWNAIDPNAALDQSGTPWLVFGSFWSGIKAVRLDTSGARADDQLHALATRQSASGAIEAPYVVHHCGYYYLFTSFDQCCKGADSTYNIRVGRASSILGPYVDRDGTAMLQGGGTLVLQGGTRWRGPGHNAVLLTDHGAFNVYHSYDANNGGQSVLRISELVWDDQGWPVSGGP